MSHKHFESVLVELAAQSSPLKTVQENSAENNFNKADLLQKYETDLAIRNLKHPIF